MRSQLFSLTGWFCSLALLGLWGGGMTSCGVPKGAEEEVNLIWLERKEPREGRPPLEGRRREGPSSERDAGSFPPESTSEPPRTERANLPEDPPEPLSELPPEPHHESVLPPESTPEEPLWPREAPPERVLPPERRSPPEPPPEVVLDSPSPIGQPCQVSGVAGVCLKVADCTGNRQATPGHCPGPTNVQCCTPRSSTPTCDPKAKPTPNTGLSEAPGLGGCPAGMVRVSTFCIDRYEASLVEVLSSGQTRSWSPYFPPTGRRVRALSLRGAVPQGYITGKQASAACAEAGKRLCSDQEWLRACRGPNSRVYPYGNQRQPGVCNDARAKHPVVEYFGTTASWIWSKLGHPCINQLPHSLARTGSHPGCVTAEGVYDMMGNLHEWTSDPKGTFRGGYYVDTYRNGNGCLYRTTAHNTAHWDYSTGFRCCAAPRSP